MAIDGDGARIAFPALRTARLDLVPLDVAHAAEMAEVLSDPALHRFTGGTPADAAALRARYERLVAGSPEPGVVWRNWVVRLREEACLVGAVQATIAPHAATAELAWEIGVPWQGRGLAKEAARGLVAWLRAIRVGTLLAHVHPDHHASAAVAAAAGLAATDAWHDGERRWQLTLTS